jgi:hypothetical protein
MVSALLKMAKISLLVVSKGIVAFARGVSDVQDRRDRILLFIQYPVGTIGTVTSGPQVMTICVRSVDGQKIHMSASHYHAISKVSQLFWCNLNRS